MKQLIKNTDTGLLKELKLIGNMPFISENLKDNWK
jgi:hypothetical protein